MQFILAQVPAGIFFQILNAIFIAALVAIPILLINYCAKYMKSSLRNQQQIIQKLDEIKTALHEK